MALVSNTCIYGLEEAVKASKYPMLTDVEAATDEITEGVIARGNAPRGTGHDQFLTGIIVQFDLTFSLKAWTELQRYHFIDFVSSQSTMHRITKFDIRNSCRKEVDYRIIAILQEKIRQWEHDPTPENFQKIIYNIPTGFKLTARMTTNYRQLKTIWYQRHDHKLPEWREFCDYIKDLPHFEELCLGGE